MGNKRLLPEGYYQRRFEVLERDDFMCQYCGQHAPNVPLEVDHKISIAEGGDDSLGNLITSCWACNRGKEGLRVRRTWMNQKPPTAIDRIPYRNKTRLEEVYELVVNHPGLTYRAIASQLGGTSMAANIILVRLKKRGLIDNPIHGGGWFAIP